MADAPTPPPDDAPAHGMTMAQWARYLDATGPEVPDPTMAAWLADPPPAGELLDDPDLADTEQPEVPDPTMAAWLAVGEVLADQVAVPHRDAATAAAAADLAALSGLSGPVAADVLELALVVGQALDLAPDDVADVAEVMAVHVAGAR